MSQHKELLAINGGDPIRNTPFPMRTLFGEEEKAAVTALFDEAMKNGHGALGYNGPQEDGYCKDFAELMGGGFADGVNSGTNAVYVALRSLEPEPFTEVIVPAITDAGGMMPVALCNCIPVPADCAPGTFNIGVDQIEARLTKRTSAIIVAHIFGTPADMDPIMELAASRNIPVLEDCAQAHGAIYKGKRVGSIGDVAAFSTMFGKHHATGGQGGIVFTTDEERYWKIRRYADRGKPFDLENSNGNVVAALNCNMDELHATIGRAQLRKLPGMTAQRRRVAMSLADGCRGLCSIAFEADPPDCEGVYWWLFFSIDISKLSVDKPTFIEAMQAEGIPAQTSYAWAAPSRMDWFTKRNVFGASGLPWSAPEYKGDASAEYALPNMDAADAGHFRIGVDEGYTEQEANDIIAALTKVEAAYLA